MVLSISQHTAQRMTSITQRSKGEAFTLLLIFTLFDASHPHAMH